MCAVAGHMIRDEGSRVAAMAHAWNNAMFSIKERPRPAQRRKATSHLAQHLHAANGTLRVPRLTHCGSPPPANSHDWLGPDAL